MARESGLIRRGVLWLLLLGPLFFISYGLSNSYTAGRADIGSLVFAWEQHVPLWPWTIIPYWSIDLLYGLSFLLPLSRQEMDRHALALLSAQLISVSCFLLWPLRFTFERPELSGLFGWLFDVLTGFDKPYNQAPSLHIALLVIIWTMFARHTRKPLWRWAVHGWMALIGLSVLTTWQHHFIDVPTGALAGFACLWLWPQQGPAPLQQLRPTQDRQRLRLAVFYTLGALLLGLLAASAGHGSWWLFWPALSVLMVALNYALFGADGFQKGADGRLSVATSVLMAPYLLAAWCNSRVWTWKHPQVDEVCDGVFLGRMPGRGDAGAFTGIVDLSAELPCVWRFEEAIAAVRRHDTEVGAKDSQATYRSLPTLDLTAPGSTTLEQAARAIEALRSQGPVLVCCALGYSRSASAVAAWLLLTGRSADVDQAQALVRKARPGVTLHRQHRAALQRLQVRP